ncbi:hypothetical protein AJ79_08993 [Helicocarpus griseus UAMH5409]|uniref:Uncharacterized protein n=1 Tax=Helicocarpus griseus UAMH5409 TaxID=1447875 RepID=A0A2B7WNI6_9EURO|nr:hypothetical protein AJ79_08993 [Helicocarpus griseus UAMH5409]
MHGDKLKFENMTLPSEPISSPGPIVSSENQLKALIVTQVKNRIRHALRSTFNGLGNRQLEGLQELTRVSYGEGEGAKIINNYKPDASFFDETVPATTSWNRAPVPIRRRDNDGNLDLVHPISWDTRGGPGKWNILCWTSNLYITSHIFAQAQPA